MDVELVARSSLSSLQRTADESFIVSPDNLEDWTWSNLRKQFQYKSLERLYLIYRRKLENGYMSLFVLLQLILGIVHCTILILEIHIKNAIVDLIACGTVNALLFPIIAVSFRSELIAKKSYLPVYFSCLIIALLVIGDLSVTVYYTLNGDEASSFRPAYATHTLLVCYIFLPLPNNLHAFILGITASFCYLASLLLITYRAEPNYTKITMDFMYHSCINGLGLYFRFMNEIMIRRSFLDRRKCVESTLRLNYEKDQEEQLTRSILPPHFSEKIKKNFRDICKFIEAHKKPSQESRLSSSMSKDLYVETHENVSILYADVVNFSGLTITLPVKKLVETLNDLFGSFDEASERHNVLRIKFLGDCYYCVSGVPIPNYEHAKSCVELGLDMIKIINHVRVRVQNESGVDVNMRIGVHSGKIISGILGINKWQFDVWSRDVIIANKMEQTGEAGKVHITQQTLNLLDTSLYNCKPVTKLNDDILQQYGIFQSYLITPTGLETSYSLELSNDVNPEGHTRYDWYPKSVTSCRPNSVNGSINYDDNFRKAMIIISEYDDNFRKDTDKQIVCTTTENMSSPSVKKQHTVECTEADVYASSFRRRTHFMDSCLRDYHLMLKEADAEMEKAIEQMPLSKWEQWCKWENINPLFLTFSQWSWEIPYLREPDPLFKFYVACSALVLLFIGLIFLLPLFTKNHRSNCYVTDSSIASYIIALVFIICLIPATWTQFLWTRYKELYDESENCIQQQPRNSILNFFYKASVQVVWNKIIRIALYIAIIALIATTAVFNSLLVCRSNQSNQENITLSSITETEMTSKRCDYTPWQMTDCCALVIFTTFLFLRIHFLLKLCTGMTIVTFYAWNVWDKQSFWFQCESETSNPYLKIQLVHTLPVVYLIFSLHLIDRQAEYLNRLDYQWKRQLTKEQDEAFHTRNANKLLLRNILPEHVGTTYMAACGLETSRRSSTQSNIASDNDVKYNVVEVMIQFAVEMMDVLENIKMNSTKPYKLRIGVSHGEVTAGVVGAQKPLYDIWGDAVNMASRMDTTGEPGKIQITKDTAEILEKEGIKCHLRGSTWVKPKGFVTTYFVGMDDNSKKTVEGGETSL